MEDGQTTGGGVHPRQLARESHQPRLLAIALILSGREEPYSWPHDLGHAVLASESATRIRHRDEAPARFLQAWIGTQNKISLWFEQMPCVSHSYAVPGTVPYQRLLGTLYAICKSKSRIAGTEQVERRQAMNTTRRWDCVVKGTSWAFGVVDGLLLLAAVLILVPRHILTLDSGAYVLLGLYLANWLIVLGLVGLVLTATWLLIKATTLCRQQAP